MKHCSFGGAHAAHPVGGSGGGGSGGGGSGGGGSGGGVPPSRRAGGGRSRSWFKSEHPPDPRANQSDATSTAQTAEEEVARLTYSIASLPVDEHRLGNTNRSSTDDVSCHRNRVTPRGDFCPHLPMTRHASGEGPTLLAGSRLEGRGSSARRADRRGPTTRRHYRRVWHCAPSSSRGGPKAVGGAAAAARSHRRVMAMMPASGCFQPFDRGGRGCGATTRCRAGLIWRTRLRMPASPSRSPVSNDAAHGRVSRTPLRCERLVRV